MILRNVIPVYLVGVDPFVPYVPLFLAIILQEIVFLVIIIPMIVAVGMAVALFFCCVRASIRASNAATWSSSQ